MATAINEYHNKAIFKMKLKISTFREPKHVEVVNCVSWNNTEDVFSCG